jgi:hypothetical protein
VEEVQEIMSRLETAMADLAKANDYREVHLVYRTKSDLPWYVEATTNSGQSCWWLPCKRAATAIKNALTFKGIRR